MSWGCAKEFVRGKKEHKPMSASSAPVRHSSCSALVPFSSVPFTRAKRSRAIAMRMTPFSCGYVFLAKQSQRTFFHQHSCIIRFGDVVCGDKVSQPGTTTSRWHSLDLQGWRSVCAMLSGAPLLFPDPEVGSRRRALQRLILLCRRGLLYPFSFSIVEAFRGEL